MTSNLHCQLIDSALSFLQHLRCRLYVKEYSSGRYQGRWTHVLCRLARVIGLERNLWLRLGLLVLRVRRWQMVVSMYVVRAGESAMSRGIVIM